MLAKLRVVCWRIARAQKKWSVFLLLAAFGLPRATAGQEAEEYEVKAAFLYNFTKFVEWPRFDTSAFTICVLGEDPFGTSLELLIKSKSAYGHPLHVRQIKQGSVGKECQIVFVTASEKKRASQLIEETRGTPVLTVGETREFLRMGGMVFLETEGSRVSVVINTTVVESADFKVSAKLMTLARTYKP